MNSNDIIGTPIKIGNLEVAQNDFVEKMPWEEAKSACLNLGDGWRLPTIEEAKILFKHRNKIGGFQKYSYWTSTELASNFIWNQGFTSGKSDYNFNKNGPLCVRAVRTI